MSDGCLCDCLFSFCLSAFISFFFSIFIFLFSGTFCQTICLFSISKFAVILRFHNNETVYRFYSGGGGVDSSSKIQFTLRISLASMVEIYGVTDRSNRDVAVTINIRHYRKKNEKNA